MKDQPPTPASPTVTGALEQLRQAEERFSLFVDSVQDYAMLLLDPEGRIVSWNEGARRIKGYAAEEVLGRHFALFYAPEDVAAGKCELAMATAIRNGRYQEEGWRVRKDGSRFWASVVVTALFDQRGALRGFGKVTRDFSDRQASEALARTVILERAARDAAEAQERKTAAIMAAIADGITVQDRRGALIYANDAGARTCGFDSAAELMAAPLSEILARFEILDGHGELLSSEVLPGRIVLRTGEPAQLTLAVRDKRTGREFWSTVRATPILDDRQEIVGAVNVWHDVTEERRATHVAAFLAEAAKLLASGLDSQTTLERVARAAVPAFADYAAVDLEDGGTWRRVAVTHAKPERAALAATLNERFPPSADAATGVPQVFRSGRSEIYPSMTEAMFRAAVHDPQHLALLLELGLRSAVIVPLIARGKVLAVLTLCYAESGRNYSQADLEVIEELGRRAGLAVDNARLYEEARAAIKLRDDFLSIAGHELKTPLAALNLQVASLERAIDTDPEKLKQRYARMTRHCMRLSGLINELLDVSRLSSGGMQLNLESLDLATLVREVAERFADEANSAGCTLEIAATAVEGTWDRFRLDQVITNLLANAIKYGKGGAIEIEVGEVDGAPQLSVRDHGIGVPAGEEERIFGRFARAVSDPHFGGLGLGLWISRKIVNAHGGRISARRNADVGTTFVVQLPLVAPARDTPW
jgi:PAS domain S-box-containing protein